MPAFLPNCARASIFSRGAEPRIAPAAQDAEIRTAVFFSMMLKYSSSVRLISPHLDELKHFAFGHDISHFRNKFQNIEIADSGHQHVGFETKKIADQNADGVSENFIGGSFAAPD